MVFKLFEDVGFDLFDGPFRVDVMVVVQGLEGLQRVPGLLLEDAVAAAGGFFAEVRGRSSKGLPMPVSSTSLLCWAISLPRLSCRSMLTFSETNSTMAWMAGRRKWIASGVFSNSACSLLIWSTSSLRHST